jgi:hypothetical protein
MPLLGDLLGRGIRGCGCEATSERSERVASISGKSEGGELSDVGNREENVSGNEVNVNMSKG